MVNTSQTKDLRFWKKWKESGAVEIPRVNLYQKLIQENCDRNPIVSAIYSLKNKSDIRNFISDCKDYYRSSGAFINNSDADFAVDTNIKYFRRYPDLKTAQKWTNLLN